MERGVQTRKIGYSGSLEPLVGRVSSAFSLGNPRGFGVLENGYEDLNIAISTGGSEYVAKVFAKSRTQENVSRYVDIMRRVQESDVNHPGMLRTVEGGLVYSDRQTGGLQAVVMGFIRGGTFLDRRRAPDAAELDLVAEQASRINGMDFHPPYESDSWGVTNLEERYRNNDGLLLSDDRRRVEEALSMYGKIQKASLPHCYVHGDLIKANVMKGTDGTGPGEDSIFPIDFSVSNWYPRIHELAVIAADLMYDGPGGTALSDRCGGVVSAYEKFADRLTKEEKESLYAYALAVSAALFLGASREKKINGNDSAETMELFESGRGTLAEALRRA